jgi:hypothetical protein
MPEENQDAHPPGKTKKAPGKSPTKKPPLDTDAMLREIISKSSIEHTPGTEAETLSRPSVAEKDAGYERAEMAKSLDHRRLIEMVSLCAALTAAAVVRPVRLRVPTNDTQTPERKAWAAPLLTPIVGGLIGYLTGRVPGRPSEK